MSLWHVRMLAMAAEARLQKAEDGGGGASGNVALLDAAEVSLRAAFDAVLHRLAAMGPGTVQSMPVMTVVGSFGVTAAPSSAEVEAMRACARKGAVLSAILRTPYLGTIGPRLAKLLQGTGRRGEGESVARLWRVHAC